MEDSGAEDGIAQMIATRLFPIEGRIFAVMGATILMLAASAMREAKPGNFFKSETQVAGTGEADV